MSFEDAEAMFRYAKTQAEDNGVAVLCDGLAELASALEGECSMLKRLALRGADLEALKNDIVKEVLKALYERDSRR